MKRNDNLIKVFGLNRPSLLYVNNSVNSPFFTNKWFLYLKSVIHFFIAFVIGALESVDLDPIQIVICLFIFFLLIYLNFQLFFYYNKEKNGRIAKKNLAYKNIYIYWVISNLKFSLFIFMFGFLYNKFLIPGIVSNLNIDPDFQIALLLILIIGTPQIFIIYYFLNSTSWLEKFYFYSYLITLRWILIFIIILFVSGYNLELSSFLLLLLSTGLLSIFSEIEIFSKLFNYLINYIEVVIANYSKLFCSYWGGAFPSYKLIKFSHNSKIPFYLKREVIDSHINLKVNINNIVKTKNIVSVTTRYVPSIFDFKTNQILISRIILEVIIVNNKFCSHKLLGGASSSNNNLNSLLFPGQPLLLNNQTTFEEYLLNSKNNLTMSNKFVDLFFNKESFNEYKDLIIDSRYKYILSVFAALYNERTPLVCFGVNTSGNLVRVNYDQVFYNDKPNLSLYKFIGTYKYLENLIIECKNKNIDHWVGGFANFEWYGYAHEEELKNFPSLPIENLFCGLLYIVKGGRYILYDPEVSTNGRRALHFKIEENYYKLPIDSPVYLTVNSQSVKSFISWKNADKINSFFKTSNNLRTLELPK